MQSSRPVGSVRMRGRDIHYRVTSLIRNHAPLGPYSRTMPSPTGPMVVLGGGVLWARYPCSPPLSLKLVKRLVRVG